MLNIILFSVNFIVFNFSVAMNREDIDKVNNQKRLEQINNEKFYKEVLEKDENNSKKRQEWRDFLDDAKYFLTKLDYYPKKTLNIVGIELEAFDISKAPYSFLIHTTKFNLNKSNKILHYYLEQSTNRAKKQIYPYINFDICPLLSTSIINPNTGGYTTNGCNAGTELQIHLILDVDERSINHMGPYDIYSPAGGSINAYLHNKNNKLGREAMPQYFFQHVKLDYSPEELLKYTFCDFNEVVVLGNNYTRFFPNSKDIKILAIGISKYWLDKRKYPSKESIEALKELSKVIPLVYYEPETPSSNIDCYLAGKGDLEAV